MSLNLSQKAEILRKLDSGISGKRLAQDYKVSEGTITYIKKKREEILNAIANSCDEAKTKRLRKAENPELEDALYKWFLDQRACHAPIDGNILRAKAKAIFNQANPGDNTFKASDGWFRNFKKRKGIRFLTICGEKTACDYPAIDPFIRRFRSKVDEMGLSEDQIYNADKISWKKPQT